MAIENIQGVRADISEMLSRIREISNKTDVFNGGSTVTSTRNFSDVMSMAKNVVTDVNQAQTQSETLKNAYISGDSSVSMSQVIVASEKSKLAFEGLIAVRNKILDAYKEIMSMPV